MTNPDQAVTPEASDAAEKQRVKAGIMQQLHNHPRLKKLIIVQSIILAVLAMITVGGLAYKATQLMIRPEEQQVAAPASLDVAAQPINGNKALVLSLRPKGATLVGADWSQAYIDLHFRGQDGDILMRYDRRTGAVTRVEIP